MKIKKLDELQLIKRGNVFKNCLFVLIGLLFLNIVMLESGMVFIDQRSAMVLMILSIVVLLSVQMIYYEIYPLSEKRQRAVYAVAGLFGLAAVVFSAVIMATGEAAFVENAMLSEIGSIMIMGGLFLTIPIAYFIRRVYNKRASE